MKITLNPSKRDSTLAHRDLDFAVDAEKVFCGETVTMIDDRFDYGEMRRISAGFLDGCMDRAGREPPDHFNEVPP